MLPELLFSVGSSMQDISREDFSLLNGGCDKESTIIPNTDTTLDAIKLGRTPDLEPVSIKLEEPADIYSWHTTATTEIGSNLLHHSDDPLISGAIDDNQNEFSPIAANKKKNQPSTKQTTSTLVEQKKPPRTRRKGQFKLRFHHQALPQEYLDHYEATQNILQKKKAENTSHKLSPSTKSTKSSHVTQMTASTTAIDQHHVNRSNESVRNWLQKISEYHGDSPPIIQIKEEPEISISSSGTLSTVGKQTSRVISYNDLPYMGEMTLDNSKPRRGRKPKKADICHLIYKNYGTILPGTPKNAVNTSEKSEIDIKKTDIQSKIINSLLEKRLTQENRKCQIADMEQNELKLKETISRLQAEPLNLCVRDRSDTLTVSSDTDTEESVLESTRTTSPIIPPSDTDTILATNLKMALPNFQSALLEPTSMLENSGPRENETMTSTNVCWPDAGVFMHPMAIYYQKMVDVAGATVPSTLPGNMTTIPVKKENEPISPVIIDEKPPTSAAPKKETHAKILVPKNISQLMKQDKVSPLSIASKQQSKSPSETSSTSSKSTISAPQKRKRSAIFIPPMPQDTTSNHATEVSICKFKFTGGAKPSLQEKKMLSVDSGGNFRYYSGTGDKSMRGYEFFPRESLQQSALMTGSSSGAFLNTPGEKIPLDMAPPSHGLSNELLQIPDIVMPTVNVSNVHQTPTNLPPPPPPPSSMAGHPSERCERRKRKSRRSLQREKLEKTFKEKGFLIQTQQLESAEGATYCKFRQLRKFTRYLFRSWKDYLPGELQQQQLPTGTAETVSTANSSCPIAQQLIGSDKSNTLLSNPMITAVNSIETVDIKPPTVDS